MYSDAELIASPLITNLLNNKELIINIMEILYMMNIIITYVLNLYPANSIIESYLFYKVPEGNTKFWLVNLSRTMLVAFTIGLGIGMVNSIGKLVSLLGSIAATPMAFVFPCGFHYKLVAMTKKEKYLDIAIMAFGLSYMCFGTVFTIVTWNKGT